MNGMFTERVKRVMQLAREESVRLGTDYVGTEHLLLGLLKEGEGVAITALRNLAIDLEDLGREIENGVAPGGNAGLLTIGQLIPFTPRAKKVLEVAAQEARTMTHRYIGTEHLLLALLKEVDSVASTALSNHHIEYERTKEEIERILTTGNEQSQNPSSTASGSSYSSSSADPAKKKSKTPFLEHYGRDLTELARAGMLDPIIGRSGEIERIIQILCRRKKNNPVLIGEPGVGKTAIIEGLAQQIVEKRIPEILENRRVIVLDMASMVAGTKYRGQFEERLKTLMVELQKNKDVIIFIDELHTIVGAGGSEGSLDASNIFKPALARGELQCIGATTLDEYRKYIEKDGALERRFQTIVVEPPSPDEAVEIIKGLRAKYEQHHKVTYTDKAVEASVHLTERYITERALPDKAIDIIDEAGARVHLSGLEIPPDLRAKEERLVEITTLKESAVENQDYEDAARLRDEQDNLRKEIDELKQDWRDRKKNDRLVVDVEQIRDVVAKITGIPLSKINTTSAQKLLSLESDLRTRVVGQEKAIKAIAKAVRRSRAGVQNARRPMGSFMFLGPTGVGKTELVKALAAQLFGSEDNMVRIDMSEYMEKFNVSRLIGAPPGYVGYDDQGGQLTERVRKRPYCVVLFDEIEKAHPDVFNVLLQILDDGQITDSHGRKVNFKNTLIVMTSNVGAKFLRKGTAMGFAKGGEEAEQERLEQSIKEEVKRTFNPEFINRVDDMITFRPLNQQDLEQIVDILLADLSKHIAEKKITLHLDQSAKDLIIKEGFDPLLGARPLRRSIQRLLEDELAEAFLAELLPEGAEVLVKAKEKKLVLEVNGQEVLVQIA